MLQGGRQVVSRRRRPRRGARAEACVGRGHNVHLHTVGGAEVQSEQEKGRLRQVLGFARPSLPSALFRLLPFLRPLWRDCLRLPGVERPERLPAALAWSGPTMATVRLLGPDLPNPLIVPVAVSDTVGRLKEIAVENWPSGESCGDRAALRAACPAVRAAHGTQPWRMRARPGKLQTHDSVSACVWPVVRRNGGATRWAAENHTPGAVS